MTDLTLGCVQQFLIEEDRVAQTPVWKPGAVIFARSQVDFADGGILPDQIVDGISFTLASIPSTSLKVDVGLALFSVFSRAGNPQLTLQCFEVHVGADVPLHCRQIDCLGCLVNY